MILSECFIVSSLASVDLTEVPGKGLGGQGLSLSPHGFILDGVEKSVNRTICDMIFDTYNDEIPPGMMEYEPQSFEGCQGPVLRSGKKFALGPGSVLYLH